MLCQFCLYIKPKVKILFSFLEALATLYSVGKDSLLMWKIHSAFNFFWKQLPSALLLVSALCSASAALQGTDPPSHLSLLCLYVQNTSLCF